MKAQFDLQLTNQQNREFRSRPLIEIQYSSCLFFVLSLNEKSSQFQLLPLLCIVHGMRLDITSPADV